MKYAALIGIFGGIGIVVGAMQLGRRLPDMVIEFIRVNDEFIDYTFRE